MKNSNNSYLSTTLHSLKKFFFWGQIIVISLAVPSLYCIGLTYKNDKASQKQLLLNNKGKKILASEKAGNLSTGIVYLSN